MPIVIDPEQHEVRALRAAANWRRKRVIEIGCGDGRLSERLASMGAWVDGIDTEPALLAAARRKKPARLAARLRYHLGDAQHLKWQEASVDRVVFAWSL